MAKKKSKGVSASPKMGADVGNNNLRHDEDDDGSDDASSSSSSSDDDSLVLEGVLVRNPDVSDSDDDDDEDDDISSDEEEEKEKMEPTKKKAKKAVATNDDRNKNPTTAKKQQQKQKQQKPSTKKKQKQSKANNEPETVQVEFLFCDMHTRFFHGMKTLLHRFGIHASHSSQLADLIIENEMVGTVLSTDIDNHEATKKQKQKQPSKTKSKSPSNGTAAATSTSSTTTQEEANVFGFASIINVTTNHSNPCIQSLKSLCLQHCPTQHKSEMQTVLSGNTARPAGFFFHERMVNVPLEITEVLHQQLVLDMDYAVNNADDEQERKSLDFGAFVRLAPCYYTREGGGGGGGGGVIYKYFDDEVFATNAEFVYNFEIPKLHDDLDDDVGGGSEGEKLGCSVIVLTKTGHRVAMKELKTMIHGG